MPHEIIMKLVHWQLKAGLLHLVQQGGDWAGLQPAQVPPHCTKYNSPPINGQCTNGPLLCSFNMSIKELIWYWLSCVFIQLMDHNINKFVLFCAHVYTFV